MTQSNQNFNAAAVGAKFKNACVRFDSLLAQGNNEELTAIRKKLREELKEYREQGILGVAFVGQYSAGKSTIISALTGRRDIHIDADIATDKTASYDWNGIKLIDTPGLFTDRKDHDEITYEAINKSDLLVFCLTYMLFDSLTAENFKKLAYEKGYRWKMMLVINKMSDEAGEEEQKITNYRKSLAEALKPYNLDEFPICYIDAKDYCEGVDEDDEFLLEVSRFQTYIDALNNFVERRAALTRYDTPVRIALSCVDEAQLSFTRNSSEDSAFLEVLARLSRTVRRERDRLRTKVRSIALRLSSAVAKEGTVLATAVGGKEDIKALSDQAENNVKGHYEKVGTELEEVVKVAVESLREEVKEVLQGDLTQAFVARLEVNQKVSTRNVESDADFERLMNQVKQLEKIGKTVGSKLTDLAAGRVSTVSGQGFLHASNAAGSNLHHGVYAIGKLIGFDFKPWQAVNIAKDIANVAMVVGPILGIVSVAMDMRAVKKEEELDKKLAEARREITSQFIAIAKDLEGQVEEELRKVEVQVYGEIEKQIAAARQQEESAIASSNTWVKQLAEIRQDFDLILRYITKATENTRD
ncbi:MULTISPECIES: GTPase [Cyanophyceae]|uniref:GTPase n=1 Tax=Cyanophyceae TaxID=3028117 RepID=UPI0016832BEA|nr:GTPase [Trichocoleus sp. FACHB-69]MBD1934355.1 50S ribosome-binding GTPase [Trichocoleus sp. FACHB-69]